MPTTVRVNRAALQQVTRGPGAVQLLGRVGAAAVREAQRRANGAELAASVHFTVDTAAGTVAIGSDHPLATITETGSRPHTIETTGYPMRDQATGDVFGTTVSHPGTKPQPFLRPSLAAVRRAV